MRRKSRAQTRAAVYEYTLPAGGYPVNVLSSPPLLLAWIYFSAELAKTHARAREREELKSRTRGGKKRGANEPAVEKVGIYNEETSDGNIWDERGFVRTISSGNWRGGVFCGCVFFRYIGGGNSSIEGIFGERYIGAGYLV